MKYLLLACCVYCLSSCISGAERSTSEQIAETTVDSFNSIKEDEPLTDNTARVKDSLRDAENFEKLLGYWLMPHAASINIKFLRDGRFVFNDYNKAIGKEETLAGKFLLQGTILTLLYDDRPKQKFKFAIDENGSYSIRSNDYYFVGPAAEPKEDDDGPSQDTSSPGTGTEEQ